MGFFEIYMFGVCWKVTPYANVMKLGTVGHLRM